MECISWGLWLTENYFILHLVFEYKMHFVSFNNTKELLPDSTFFILSSCFWTTQLHRTLFHSYSFKMFPAPSTMLFFMWQCHISLLSLFSPMLLLFPVLGSHSFLLSVYALSPRGYLFSQLSIITLQEQIISSDPVPFVSKFTPGFAPIYPILYKLIPLKGVISYIR